MLVVRPLYRLVQFICAPWKALCILRPSIYEYFGPTSQRTPRISAPLFLPFAPIGSPLHAHYQLKLWTLDQHLLQRRPSQTLEKIDHNVYPVGPVRVANTYSQFIKPDLVDDHVVMMPPRNKGYDANNIISDLTMEKEAYI